LSIWKTYAPQWVGGDLNLPDVNWSSITIVVNTNTRDINQQFIDCIHSCGAEQVVNFSTRHNMTLDLFLTNRPSQVNKCTAAPDISDHAIVQIRATTSARRTKPLQRKIYQWKKANLDTMRYQCRHIADAFCHKYTIQSPIEDMWTSIKNSLLRLQD
jgi:hypothetical protein